MNQTSTDDNEINNALCAQSADELRKQLNLKYVAVFHWKKAVRILWSSACLMAMVYFFSVYGYGLNTIIAGSIFAILHMMSLFGAPFALKLDAPSQRRFDNWLESQRESV